MRHWIVLSLLACWLLAPSVAARAALATRVELVTDGSSDPPGDRLQLTVLFLPGEEKVDLELRAFARLQGQIKVRPVASKNKDQAGPHGELLIKQSLARPADSTSEIAEIVIPFASLDIGVGSQHLGYEVRGLRGDTVDFVKATELGPIEITKEPRTLMKRLVAFPPQAVETRQKRTVTVIGADGKPTTKEVEVPNIQAEVKKETQQLEVNIPGGFVRADPPPTRAVPPANNPKAAAVPLEGHAWESLGKFEPKPKRTVYYATNRTIDKPQEMSIKRFGNSVGALSFGQCVVNIPVEAHTKGQIELPGWWDSTDPKRHFIVESLGTLNAKEFAKQISGDDILLFVHGYYNSFEFAILRTGQLMHDLQFPGRAVAFSWPSAGALSGYFHDQEQIADSVPSLVQLFETLATPKDAKPRKVHAIVHSMGNRIFMQAIKQFELKHGKEAAGHFFGQVALAAPDIDGALFGALIPSLIRQSDHVTFYYCSSDRALTASQQIHQDKPVGLGPTFAEGMDTINADAVNTDTLGHGYYASANELLVDLRLLIRHHLLPDQRLPPLNQTTTVLGFSHWSFIAPK